MAETETAPNDWDAFVAASPHGAYTQLTPWAEVKRVNGWRAHYADEHTGAGRVGAQVLVRKLGLLPWAVGYAPRGPVAAEFSADGVHGWTDGLRRHARDLRLTHVTVDPEVEEGHPLADWLQDAGWTRGERVQPDRTRLIDLTAPEEQIWSGLRSKWRQYVQKARRGGVAIVTGTEADLDDFYRIYVDTAQRAGFVHRAKSAYIDVYGAFAKRGAARLLFAQTSSGERVATLMLIECGRRAIEPYGGMTQAGADTRANYLLKWEAIRSSRERGFAVYDLWGLAHTGIEQFKAGFGGREVRYIGAWQLVTNRPLTVAVRTAQRGRVALARARQGIGRAPAGAPGDAG